MADLIDFSSPSTLRESLPVEKYQAFWPPCDVPVPMITFVLGDGSRESFCYVDLSRVRFLNPDQPGQGPVLVLRFLGREITDVTVKGRGLQRMYYSIVEHRIALMSVFMGRFDTMGDDATVINSITLQAIG
jgi:hypothetical protein